MAYSEETLSIAFDETADDTRQLIDLWFPIVKGNSSNNRKDSYDIKFTINTGGSTVYVLIYVPGQTAPIQAGTLNTNSLEESILDISEVIGVTKSWQLRLVGLVHTFKLSEIIIYFDQRPEQLKFLKHRFALGPNKKRIRVIPVTIDTLGEEVTIIGYVDGVAGEVVEFTSSYPKTIFYHFAEDVFGVDYEISIRACDVFELYKIHAPVGVQILPIAKRFDQVGPEDFFRYGKIHSLLIRLAAFGGTEIPVKIYMQDDEVYETTLTVVDGVEDVYEVKVPKTTAGTVTRVELGPTEFDFHRYYIHMKVAKAGRDTEMEWVPLVDNYGERGTE